MNALGEPVVWLSPADESTTDYFAIASWFSPRSDWWVLAYEPSPDGMMGFKIGGPGLDFCAAVVRNIAAMNPRTGALFAGVPSGADLQSLIDHGSAWVSCSGAEANRLVDEVRRRRHVEQANALRTRHGKPERPLPSSDLVALANHTDDWRASLGRLLRGGSPMSTFWFHTSRGHLACVVPADAESFEATCQEAAARLPLRLVTAAASDVPVH